MGRILVVDDDPDILKMAEQILSQVGHTVFVAEDALRAIDWLDNYSFDLMLSDANMPHYSGFDLINTVRNNDKFKEMGIAMLTGLRERRDVERAVKAGVDDYIVKPIDPLILVQKVSSLFEKRPPRNYPEISLSETKLGHGELTGSLVIESVSELGIKILTSMPLQPGVVLDVQSDFFRALDAEPPPMKVLNVEKDPTSNQYRAQLIYLGAREALLQKIRRWLYTHTGHAKIAV